MGLLCCLPDTDQQHLRYEPGNFWKSLLPKNDNTNLNRDYRVVSIHDPVCNIYRILALFLVPGGSCSAYCHGACSTTDFATDGGPGAGDGNADFILGYEVP